MKIKIPLIRQSPRKSFIFRLLIWSLNGKQGTGAAVEAIGRTLYCLMDFGRMNWDSWVKLFHYDEQSQNNEILSNIKKKNRKDN